MEQAELAHRLDALAARLEEIGSRLDRIEGTLAADVGALREKLDYERESRKALAEQTSWLIEVLGDARKEVRRLKQQGAG